jgi:hypothetical protein
VAVDDENRIGAHAEQPGEALAQLTLVLLFADVGDAAGIADVLCKEIALGCGVEAKPHQLALCGPHPKGSGDCFVGLAPA